MRKTQKNYWLINPEYHYTQVNVPEEYSSGTVAVVNNKFERKVREALEIQKHDCYYTKGGMNQDKGQYVNTTFWLPFMKYLRKSEDM